MVIQSLSLCSGVGWLDEGFRAGCEHLGWIHRCVGYCERDAYAAAVLLARMADASLEQSPIWCGDIAELDAKPLRGWANAVVAGFPCQPWSAAGKQQGTADTRWLWPAIVRIIVDLEPSIVFLENVSGLISGGGIEHVLSDLAAIGFDAEWLTVSAAEVGAAHKRERVFILAYRPSARSWRLSESSQRSSDSDVNGSGDKLAIPAIRGQRELRESSERDRQLNGSDGVMGDPERNGRRIDEPQRGQDRGSVAGWTSAELANAERNGRSSRQHGLHREAEKSQRGDAEDSQSRSGIVANAECPPSQGDRPGEPKRRRFVESRDADGSIYPLFAPGPGDIDGWGRVVADGSFDFRAPAIKPGFCVLVDGVSLVVDASRADQLRCGGNGVVALQAAVAFVELVRRVGATDERESR